MDIQQRTDGISGFLHESNFVTANFLNNRETDNCTNANSLSIPCRKNRRRPITTVVNTNTDPNSHQCFKTKTKNKSKQRFCSLKEFIWEQKIWQKIKGRETKMGYRFVTWATPSRLLNVHDNSCIIQKFLNVLANHVKHC